MSPATLVVRACLLAASVLLGSCGPASHGKVASIGDLRTGKSGPGIPKQPATEVSVLDPGSEPRAPLRYRIPKGLSESLVMEVGVQLKLVVGDMAPNAPNPTVRVSMAVHALSGTPRLYLEGKVVKLELVEDPAVPANLTAALRGDLDRLAGLKWMAQYDELGELQLLHLPAPADATPQTQKTLDWMREGLRTLLPPLPLVPVGKNARWQARRATTLVTAKIEETAVYKLIGPGQLAVALELGAREQPLHPGTPPGTVVTLSSLEGSGKGQIDLALDRIVQPSSLRWAANGKGTAVPAGEPPAPITLGVDVGVVVRRM